MQLFTTILIDGLVYSSYLFIVSVGLTIIFGVMKILNIAHGSFYAWGAYGTAYSIGLAANAGFPAWFGFILIFLSATVVGLVFGILIERFILRRMYDQEEVIIVLATFGLFLVLEDLLLHVFGVNSYFAYQPMAYLGSVKIGGIVRDVYSLTLLFVAGVVALGCWYGLNKTKWGKILATVIFDREISMAIGINVKMVYSATFVIGTMLGALGGAYIAPTVAVSPGFGVDIIILSFAVVVIGGMGSIPGAVIGALMVGILRAIAVHKMPEIELFVVYAVMALVLVLRPEGLFAPAQARKI